MVGIHSIGLAFAAAVTGCLLPEPPGDAVDLAVQKIRRRRVAAAAPRRGNQLTLDAGTFFGQRSTVSATFSFRRAASPRCFMATS